MATAELAAPTLFGGLALTGLTLAPPQTLGAFRLVPILRSHVTGDLRLTAPSVRESQLVATVSDPRRSNPIAYYGFVPHAFVVSWSDDGTPVAAYGAQLGRTLDEGERRKAGFHATRLVHKMVRRSGERALRLLPLHLAMEGFLALAFGGPDVAWSEYSARGIRFGLDPRIEWTNSGRDLRGLDAALRLFEIHEGQVGVLVFVADALASAFVVPHPDDYRALHVSLLEDVFGDLVHRYSQIFDTVAPADDALDATKVRSLADLGREIEAMAQRWSTFTELAARGVDGRPLTYEDVYRAGPFRLARFLPDFALSGDNHMGEIIRRDSGEVEYLKTFRLSRAQAKRAFLLRHLATRHWHLDTTASALGTTKEDLLVRLDEAGFGYLLKSDVLALARKRALGR